MSLTYQLTAGTSILRSDGACVPADPGNSDFQAYLAWLSAGNSPQQATSPTQAQIIATLESAVQAHMDGAAQGAGYDSLLSAVSYAGSAKFGAQAAVFIAWRDACWSYCYGVEAAVQAGTQAVPTAAALVAGLPPITIPAVTL